MRTEVDKYKAIVYFTNGDTLESEWFGNDVYAKEWARSLDEEVDFSHYKIEHGRFKEDFDLSRASNVHDFPKPNLVAKRR